MAEMLEFVYSQRREDLLKVIDIINLFLFCSVFVASSLTVVVSFLPAIYFQVFYSPGVIVQEIIFHL
jgi:hypothetical protein